MKNKQHPAGTGHRKPDQAIDIVAPSTPVKPKRGRARRALAILRANPQGVTTVDLTGIYGIPDPRSAIRDLRKLGWQVMTVQPKPRNIGLYILIPSKVA